MEETTFAKRPTMKIQTLMFDTYFFVGCIIFSPISKTIPLKRGPAEKGDAAGPGPSSVAASCFVASSVHPSIGRPFSDRKTADFLSLFYSKKKVSSLHPTFRRHSIAFTPVKKVVGKYNTFLNIL